MTYLKAISGHTGTGGIRRYLERGGRALAVDLLNLGDPALCEDWAAEMDRTRRLAGNDRAWGSRRARTFKHYVVSPPRRTASARTPSGSSPPSGRGGVSPTTRSRSSTTTTTSATSPTPTSSSTTPTSRPDGGCRTPTPAP